MTMEGYVSEDHREARIAISILDAGGIPRIITATIDTGFTEELALDTGTISNLGLTQTDRWVELTLAIGRADRVPTYRATLIWHQQPKRVTVLETPDEVLIGMALLWGSDVAISATANGAVAIVEQI